MVPQGTRCSTNQPRTARLAQRQPQEAGERLLENQATVTGWCWPCRARKRPIDLFEQAEVVAEAIAKKYGIDRRRNLVVIRSYRRQRGFRLTPAPPTGGASSAVSPGPRTKVFSALLLRSGRAASRRSDQDAELLNLSGHHPMWSSPTSTAVGWGSVVPLAAGQAQSQGGQVEADQAATLGPTEGQRGSPRSAQAGVVKHQGSRSATPQKEGGDDPRAGVEGMNSLAKAKAAPAQPEGAKLAPAAPSEQAAPPRQCPGRQGADMAQPAARPTSHRRRWWSKAGDGRGPTVADRSFQQGRPVLRRPRRGRRSGRQKSAPATVFSGGAGGRRRPPAAGTAHG